MDASKKLQPKNKKTSINPQKVPSKFNKAVKRSNCLKIPKLFVTSNALPNAIFKNISNLFWKILLMLNFLEHTLGYRNGFCCE